MTRGRERDRLRARHRTQVRGLALGGLLLAGCLVAGALLATGGSSARRARSLATARTAPPARPRRVKAAAAVVRPARTTSAHPPAPTPELALPKMLGQMIVARFTGPAPTPSLLDRIRRGEIGGVILFSDNVPAGTLATRSLTRELQRAAAQGHNPPLLVMTDQEGGTVKRLAGPPDLAAANMTSATTAGSEGAATGRLLRSVGVNVDLAPVADVERAQESFLATRSFGNDPVEVAARACAFARGLASQGVAYTLKHFPGLGRATGNTDTSVVAVDALVGELRDDYAAYRHCGANPRALIMVSSAIYPSVSGPLPAVMSPEIYRRELPLALGRRPPLTISDDLQSVALAAQAGPAHHAITAGLDLLMYAQTEQASAAAYVELLHEARSGLIPITALRAADQRILQLKHLLSR